MAKFKVRFIPGTNQKDEVVIAYSWHEGLNFTYFTTEQECRHNPRKCVAAFPTHSIAAITLLGKEEA